VSPCGWCGGATKRRGKKFCSHPCSAMARKRNDGPCAVAGCRNNAHQRGLCQAHHSRLVRRGSTDGKMHRPKKVDQETWFWLRTERNGECLEHLAHRVHGRPQARINGERHPASRWAWILAHGPVPAGLFVCHHCDNPLCVRPEHLFIGTVQDNSDDMVRKGRSAKGEKCGASRTNAADVVEMRRLHAEGVSTARLSGIFGISKSQAKNIVNGRHWRHVPSPQQTRHGAG
jgi:hypothetical protein